MPITVYVLLRPGADPRDRLFPHDFEGIYLTKSQAENQQFSLAMHKSIKTLLHSAELHEWSGAYRVPPPVEQGDE